MKIDITTEERDELVRLVQNYLQDTRVEVRHTQNRDYRLQLQREETLLRDLLDKLNQPLSAAA